MCMHKFMQINTHVDMTHLYTHNSKLLTTHLIWPVHTQAPTSHTHTHTHSHTHAAIITSINKNDKLRLMKGPAVTDQFNCQP